VLVAPPPGSGSLALTPDPRVKPEDDGGRGGEPRRHRPGVL